MVDVDGRVPWSVWLECLLELASMEGLIRNMLNGDSPPDDPRLLVTVPGSRYWHYLRYCPGCGGLMFESDREWAAGVREVLTTLDNPLACRVKVLCGWCESWQLIGLPEVEPS